MKVIDFRRISTGTMVKRSKHHQKEHCLKGKPQLGIMTGKEFFTDSKGILFTFPIIMWEGGTMPSLTHPSLVDVYRKKDAENIRYIEIAE